MKNAVLQRDGCAACGHAINPNWNTSNALGATCEACYEVSLFSPENFDFQVTVRPAPQDGYDFSGTRLMVNGQIGTLGTSFSNWSWINFGDPGGSTVIHLGYWEIKQLYESASVTD